MAGILFREGGTITGPGHRKVTMSVVSFTAVIRGRIVIAAYGDANCAPERDILKLVPSHSSRVEQKITGGQLFTFVMTSSLTFVAVSPQSVDKQKPIQFLETLSRRWSATYETASGSATAHGLDGVFLSNFAALFSDCNRASKTADLTRDLDETQQVLTSTMSRALDRGDELRGLSSKSESLMATSEEFRSQATNLQWKMRCQYIKSMATWTFAGMLIIYLVLSWICGGYKLGRCI